MLIKFVCNLGRLEGVFYFDKYSFEQERKRFELKIVLKSVIIGMKIFNMKEINEIIRKRFYIMNNAISLNLIRN